MNTTNQVTILIVDDVASNIFALQQLLEKENRIFLSASNGNDALKIALGKEIDLIILDVQMSGMDGFEVAHILKSNRKTRDIPVLFASANSKEHVSIMKGFEEGAVDYMLKPLDPDITRAKVSILLQIQIQKKELVEKNRSLENAGLLINNSADIIGIIDPKTLQFDEVNNAFTTILGYEKDSVKGMPVSSFLDEEHKEMLENIQRSPGERFSFETPVVDKAGDIKWLQWNVIAKDQKWFVNARDVTFQKITDDKIKLLNQHLQQNLQRLEEANRELESFSYSVSHDLRAPLRSLDGYSKILQEEYADTLNDNTRGLIETIRRNAKKMARLIDDLLEFSKLGRQDIRKAEVDMQLLVNDIIKDLDSPDARRTHFVVEPLLFAVADRSLIAQVWINLLSNAVKYSSKNKSSTVEVGCRKTDQEIIFYVKDNGVGFDMKYIDKLFNVFQRLHKSDEFEGTGIGLAIVHRIISRHGGKVWAEAGLNQGATFYFSLPV